MADKNRTKTGRKTWLIAAAAVLAGLITGGAATGLALRSRGESLGAAEQKQVQWKDFTFEKDDYGDYEVVSYDGSDEDIVIPASVHGVPVTGIRDGAFSFYDCKDMTSVVIPDGIYSLPDYLFYDCTELSSVSLPSTLREIGEGTFENCDSLASFTFPDGITSIGNGAFYDCDALEELTIPECVTDIGNGAFMNCDGLSTVTVNVRYISDEHVHTVDLRWFYYCDKLTTINISRHADNIITAVSYFDNGLPALEAINIIDPDRDNTIGSSAVNMYHSVDGVLYQSNRLVYCPRGKSGTFTVPDNVTDIGTWAFKACHGLTAINLPAGIIAVSDLDFSNCRSLEAINVAEDNPVYRSVDGVVYTKDGSTLLFCTRAYAGELNIPEGVTHIRKEACQRCDRITSVTIPESMVSIGDCAFYMTEGIAVTAPHGPDYYGYILDDMVSWQSSEGFEG